MRPTTLLLWLATTKAFHPGSLLHTPSVLLYTRTFVTTKKFFITKSTAVPSFLRANLRLPWIRGQIKKESSNENPAHAMVSLSSNEPETKKNKKDLIRTLLKGIETGDPASVAIVQDNNYIQHNPQTHEGGQGLAQLFARLSKTNPHVNVVRAYEDGHFVFAQTEYDFSTRRIGFEVFRFDDNDEYAVEHWDNIQPRPTVECNASGNSMISGPTGPSDLHLTETNRALVRNFVQTVFFEGDLAQMNTLLLEDESKFIQHSPRLANGKAAILANLQQQVSSGTGTTTSASETDSNEDITSKDRQDNRLVRYQKIHRVLAEGDTVLVVSEGYLDNVHTSFYDLYRVEDGMIVEHWETIEAVPPLSQWKNSYGNF